VQIGIGGKAGNTFGAYAVDGDGDGIGNVYNPADAIFTAASYLCRNGGGKGGDLSRAVFAYNHTDWYVTKLVCDQGARDRLQLRGGHSGSLGWLAQQSANGIAPALAVAASSNRMPAEASIQGGLDAPPGWPQQRGDDKGGDGHRQARVPTHDAQESCEVDDHGGIAQSEHRRQQAVSNAVVSDGRHDWRTSSARCFDHSIPVDHSGIVTRSFPLSH
jgi:Transglycosylase SLT domain